MQLNEFFNYKNQLMHDILTDADIVNLINEDVEFSHASELAYTQCFPFEFIPETVHEGKTFVCFDVDVQKSVNKTYLSPILYIWVFTHKSKLRLPEGRGVRTDELCSKIAQKINGSKQYGLGELDLFSAKRFAPAADFQGKVLVFSATDVSKFYNPKKTIPSHRGGD